ncbi:Rha family transcriptional regulator [Desulfovibrio subterraneus]|nr:Rha family transcriptional regulator [Desulfovibrio subterraneus]
MTTSLKVAEVFGKNHYDLLKGIESLDCSKDFLDGNFAVSSYQPAGANRSYPIYQMTRDGFTFLVMGFTGARAAEFKEQYIAAFWAMENPSSRPAAEPEVEIVNAVDLADLVVIENGQPMTTSLKVAEVFGKEHKHILRDIEPLDCSEEFRESNFGLSSYQPAGAKRSYPMYHITRDGFTFLAMGFTGARAAEFKEQYISAFNAMEQELRGRMTTAVQPMSSIEMLELQLSAMKEVNQKAELAKREAVLCAKT